MCALRQNAAENIIMVQQFVPFEKTFHGGPSGQFLHEIERYFLLNNTSEENKLKIALSALRGSAQQWYACVQSNNRITDFLSFKQELLSIFPKTFNQVDIEAEIYSLSQRQHQSALQFAIRKISLCEEFLEGVTETKILNIVIQRLKPSIQDFLDSKPITNKTELLQALAEHDKRHFVSVPNPRIPTRNVIHPRLSYSRFSQQERNYYRGRNDSNSQRYLN